MAKVSSFVKGTQSVKFHPTEVECHYQVFDALDGRTILHLSTFGSDHRESEPKSSQSLQLDEDRARELMELINDAFPSLAAPNAVTKNSLKEWVIEALIELGGKGSVVDVSKTVWSRHQAELESAGDLAFTWQYDIRWAAQKLRDEGRLVPSAAQADKAWELAG